MKPLPKEYADFRRTFPLSGVSIGYSGISLESIAGIPAAQNGYGVTPAAAATDWKESWIVVGHETSLGDPIFIDVEIEEVPVYSAPHGEETWTPSLIAPSAGAFFTILGRLARIAKGRENPVALEKNPISEEEAAQFRAFLSEFFVDEVPVFWTVMLEPNAE